VLKNRGVFADFFSKGKKRYVNVPLLKRHSRFKHPEHDFCKGGPLLRDAFAAKEPD